MLLQHVLAASEPDLARLLWLFPYFLLGDTLARLLPPVLPPVAASRAARLGVPSLAAVGRSSIVYYVCHMPVLVYAVPLLWSVGGHRAPWLVCGVAVALALATGRALARVQHARGWRWLFAWRRRRVMQPTAGNTHFPVLRDALSH